MGDSVPDGGYGWVIVLSSFIINFVVVGIPRSFGVLYIVILEKFGATATEVAWIHSLFNTSRMVLGPVSSILCNRFTSRKVVICGSLLLFLGVVACSFSTNVYFMYGTYGIVAGIGGSCLFAPSLIVVGEYFNKKKGKAMSISSMGGGFGTITLAPLFTFLMSYYGFTGGFLIIGGISLHGVIAGALLRPRKHQKYNEEDNIVTVVESLNTEKVQNWTGDCVDKTNKSDSVGTKEVHHCENTLMHTGKETTMNVKENDVKDIPDETDKKNKSNCVPALLKNRSFVLYCLTVGTMPFCLQVMFLFIADYAKEQSFDKNQRAILISVMGATDILGRILAGIIFDLKPVRAKRRLALTITGIMFGLVNMSIALAHSVPSLFVVCSLHGLSEGMFHSQRATILTEFVPSSQVPLSIGWITFFQGIGNLIGPVIGGLIRDHFQSYEFVFISGGAVFVAMDLVFLLEYVLSQCTFCKNNDSKDLYI